MGLIAKRSGLPVNQIECAMLSSSLTTNSAGVLETDLVVACVRALVSGGHANDVQGSLHRFRELSREKRFNWEEFLRKAEAHAVMPSVAHVLLHLDGELVPEEIGARLRHRLQTAAMNNLKWVVEWRWVSAAFEAAGIPVIPLKGPTLAALAYGNVALREFVDLDFLVNPTDALGARNVLAKFGYNFQLSKTGNDDWMLLRSGNRQMGFVNIERSTRIELHWGALHEMFPYQLPVDELFSAAHVARHLGASYLSLSPELYLLYLCAHGTKHCWPQLRWVCDVALYLQSAQKLDWKLCMSLAEAANGELVLKHSLLLASRVLGMELPSEIRCISEDQKAHAVAERARYFLLLTPGEPRQGEMLGYHLAFAKSLRSRMLFLYHRAFVPDEPDWQAVPLPKSLCLLYYFIRPVRILLHRLASGQSRG
jgi:Uncharacterised nucleotidyltransferase